jgi:DNA polymerase III delta prime subunit
MSDPHRYDNRVWDRFFDLLYPCDEAVTPETARAELQRAGIDMRRASSRLQQMIEAKRAQERLVQARASRAGVMDTMRGIVGPKVENLRASLDDFIGRNFSGEAQVAHYHKLQKAASEEDLQSLLDDLTRVTALEKLKDGNDPPAQ